MQGLARVFGLNMGATVDPSTLPVHMHPSERVAMHAAFEAIAPKRVVEWGSGGSTRDLLERGPFVERYVSMEHNPLWYERVKARVLDPRLELYLAEPTEPEPDPPRSDKQRGQIISQWWLKCEADPSYFHDYIHKPASLGTEFDFALVDGRARNFCMEQAYSLLRPGGLMVLHDAQRDEYRATLDKFPRVVRLEPWVQGQVVLVRKPE